MKARFVLSAAALALALSLTAGAATLPASVSANGITYLSGGIGHEEAAAMQAEARNYPLSLVFSAGKHDAFVSNVTVTIKDKAGKVLLDSAAGGPIMLVKLPAGEYTITALQYDAPLHRTVRVTGHGAKRVAFHWSKA
jgi:hypothetical protein